MRKIKVPNQKAFPKGQPNSSWRPVVHEARYRNQKDLYQLTTGNKIGIYHICVHCNESIFLSIGINCTDQHGLGYYLSAVNNG